MPELPAYPFHPIANIFPMLEGAALQELADDIATHGLHVPIVLTPNRIIVDGRNRYRAMQAVGIELDEMQHCTVTTLEGSALVAYVVGLNLKRRHLDENQRAMVADKLANLRNGQRADYAGASIEAPAVPQEQAAELLNVSRSAIQRARVVHTHGASALIEAVEQGAASLAAATEVATLPHPEQEAIVARGEQAIIETAKDLRAEKVEKATRAQVVTTVKEHMTTGATPREAVNHAFKQHAIIIPTPALADAVCQATDRQVTLAASDGYLHDGRTKEEEAARGAQTLRLFQLFDALKALATLPDIPTLIAEIPHYCAHEVEDHLTAALTKLTQFSLLWKERIL